MMTVISFLTSKWSKWIGMTLIIISVLTLAGLVRYQANKINDLETNLDQALSIAKNEKAVTTYYINKYNNEVAKSKEMELSLSNARELINTERFEFVKEFEGVNRKLSNLEKTISMNAELNLQGRVNNRDTTIIKNNVPEKAKAWEYEDEFNMLQGIAYDSYTEIKGHANVPIKGVRYFQRKHKFIFKNWRFGKKEYFNEFTSPNPLVKITDIEITEIKK